MSELEILTQPLWQRLWLTLLHFIWQGAAVAAVLVILVYLTRLQRAHSRYCFSLVALLSMIACPAITFFLVGAPLSQVSELSLSPTVIIDTEMSDTPQETLLAAALTSIQPLVTLAWLVGVTLLSGRLMLGLLGVQWLKRGRSRVGNSLESQTAHLAKRLGLRQKVRIFSSRQVRQALVVGLWRPLVLLPAAWLTEMSPEVLQAVVAHELAHVRRWDLWINLLQRVLETLCFFHPAVWWLSRRLRLEREMCCDELAAVATGSREVYAKALEQVARRKLASQRPMLAAAFSGGRNMNLLDRVRNVLDLEARQKKARWWPLGAVMLALTVGLWSSGTGLAPWSVQQAIAQEEDGDRNPQQRARQRERVEQERREAERHEQIERHRAELQRNLQERKRDLREEFERQQRELNERVEREQQELNEQTERELRQFEQHQRADGERRRLDDPQRRPRDGDSQRQRNSNARRPEEELIRLVHKLSDEVAKLRREVRQLQEQHHEMHDEHPRESEARRSQSVFDPYVPTPSRLSVPRRPRREGDEEPAETLRSDRPPRERADDESPREEEEKE